MSKNAIQDYLENETAKEKIAKAEARFEFKPFHQKFAGLKVASRVLAFLLPSISIITGAIFLSDSLSYLLPFSVLAIGFGLILVLLLEYLKSYLLNTGFTDVFAQVKGGYLIMTLGILLGLLSAFLSLQSIRHLHEQLDTSLQTLSKTQQEQSDSLNHYFDKQIEEAKRELQDFKTAISWQGKINTYNTSNAKTLQNLSSQIIALQTNKQASLQKLSTTQDKQYNILEKAKGLNLLIVLLTVLSIEILIILANWFVIFYDFKTKKQSEKLQFGQNQILFHTNELGQMLHQFLSSAYYINPLGQDLHQKIIGFQNYPQNSESDDTSGKKESKTGESNYENLINDIKNGETHRPTLTKRHRVSINLVNEFIKKYGVRRE